MAATMTAEDQELFLEMLLKLDETHDAIKAASKWCRAKAACDEEIVRMWFFAVAKAQSQNQRLYLFHLASDILFTAEPESIHYFSSFLPQIYKAIPFVRGEEIRNDMMKLFSIWRDKKIYNKVVMKQLTKSLKNRNKVVDMSIFKYDKELLFKNLKRVRDLEPACDYLSRGVDFAPSFDNSQALLSTIKERKACQALLASVDSHKSKVTSLVSYMEEMVHLLKMATTTLDIAGNKEQNGVEETKIRILAYGKYQDSVKGVLSELEEQWGLQRKDYAKPITPASPEPEEENLYSRRVGTVGVPGDPRLANVPIPPVVIPSVPTVVPPVLAAIPAVPVAPTVIASWGGAQSRPEEIFHRRDRSGSMTPRREEAWAEDLPFTNPAPPPLPTDDLPFLSPRPRLPRDSLPFTSPRAARDDITRSMSQLEVSRRPCMTPTRESPWHNPRSVTPTLDEPRREDPWETPRPVRSRDEPWTPRPHPAQDDPWETELRRSQEDPWNTPRRQTPRDEPYDTPRPHTSREEPWERSRGVTPVRENAWERSRGMTPNRDELWDRSRGVTPTQDEPFDTPRPHTSREEPWERFRGATPVRDELWERPHGSTPTREEHWSPVSPLYTGATSWGSPLKKPVYMPCYTGFHLDDPLPSERSSETNFKAPYSRDTARAHHSFKPSRPDVPEPKRKSLLSDPRPIPRLGDDPNPKRKSLLGDPRPIPRLGDDPKPKRESLLGDRPRPIPRLGGGPRRPPLLGSRPALLPSPSIAPIPSLALMRKKKRRK